MQNTTIEVKAPANFEECMPQAKTWPPEPILKSVGSWGDARDEPVHDLFFDHRPECDKCIEATDSWKDKKSGHYLCQRCWAQHIQDYFPWRSHTLDVLGAGVEKWPGGGNLLERFEQVEPLFDSDFWGWTPERPRPRPMAISYISISVEPLDCLEVAARCYQSNPCLLVMGREVGPSAGIGAHKYGQSKAVFQSTTLAEAAKAQPALRTPAQGCVYIPGVRVVLDQMEVPLKKPYRLSMVYSELRRLESLEDPLEVRRYLAYAQQKILAVLRVCAAKQHPVLILGAWGCGWPRAPPREMAALFREALVDSDRVDVARCFRKVIFAIKPRGSASSDLTLQAFQEVFSAQ